VTHGHLLQKVNVPTPRAVTPEKFNTFMIPTESARHPKNKTNPKINALGPFPEKTNAKILFH